MRSPEPAPDVKSRILAAALTLLHERGFAELTQPKVAKAAGVRQSHLTYYFPTRNQLLLAVAKHTLESLSGQMLDSGRRGSLRNLEDIAAAFAKIVTNTKRGRVLLGIVIACDNDPKIREAFTHFIVEIRQTMALLLETLGMQSDRDAVAAFHAHAIGLVVLNLARDNDESRDEAYRLMLNILRPLASMREKAKNDHE